MQNWGSLQSPNTNEADNGCNALAIAMVATENVFSTQKSFAL
jgi:hypothetical protein